MNAQNNTLMPQVLEDLRRYNHSETNLCLFSSPEALRGSFHRTMTNVGLLASTMTAFYIFAKEDPLSSRDLPALLAFALAIIACGRSIRQDVAAEFGADTTMVARIGMY
jgi:hypothetical protein